MGLALIVIGLIVWLVFGLFWLGIALIIFGLILLFIPGTYGVSDWRGRRRGAPPY